MWYWTLLALLAVSISVAASLNSRPKSWTYTLKETSSHSSNESIVKADTRIERIGRAEFALSGSLFIGVQVPEDLEVEVLAYRSPDGGDNYKLQPYSLQRQGIYAAMNSFYKDMIMDSVASCSNLPQFTEKLTVLPAQTFHYDKCQISTDSFPQYLPDGWYKLNFVTYGIVEVVWELIIIIEKKSL
ncbi:uncharacterized protein [Drosophila pseudoobscura]|uniref:Uncharacterized protein n=1 Tax=Drosophila pseudoobscura pseudoobscura TaxID=46245 RepID=A0A6I8UZS7_DROPS|nr:uncharacterized protein LOC6902242 [Drosophila pseudoobscura]